MLSRLIVITSFCLFASLCLGMQDNAILCQQTINGPLVLDFLNGKYEPKTSLRALRQQAAIAVTEMFGLPPETPVFTSPRVFWQEGYYRHREHAKAIDDTHFVVQVTLPESAVPYRFPYIVAYRVSLTGKSDVVLYEKTLRTMNDRLISGSLKDPKFLSFRIKMDTVQSIKASSVISTIINLNPSTSIKQNGDDSSDLTVTGKNLVDLVKVFNELQRSRVLEGAKMTWKNEDENPIMEFVSAKAKDLSMSFPDQSKVFNPDEFRTITNKQKLRDQGGYDISSNTLLPEPFGFGVPVILSIDKKYGDEGAWKCSDSLLLYLRQRGFLVHKIIRNDVAWPTVKLHADFSTNQTSVFQLPTMIRPGGEAFVGNTGWVILGTMDRSDLTKLSDLQRYFLRIFHDF